MVTPPFRAMLLACLPLSGLLSTHTAAAAAESGPPMACQPGSDSGKLPFCDADKTTDERVADLVARIDDADKPGLLTARAIQALPKVDVPGCKDSFGLFFFNHYSLCISVSLALCLWLCLWLCVSLYMSLCICLSVGLSSSLSCSLSLSLFILPRAAPDHAVCMRTHPCSSGPRLITRVYPAQPSPSPVASFWRPRLAYIAQTTGAPTASRASKTARTKSPAAASAPSAPPTLPIRQT